MRFFCHISFLQFSGELYSHLVLYFITIGFADYMFAKSGKLHVVCTEGFYRYDNVRITCAKYGVPVYASLTEAIGEIIR